MVAMPFSDAGTVAPEIAERSHMHSSPRRRRWTRPRIVGVALVAALAVVAVIAGVALLLPPPDSEPTTEVMRATRADQTTAVAVSGTLAPRDLANASFAVPGTVASIAVNVGDEVSAGATLATLNDTELANAVALAEANLTAARAQAQTIRDTDGATSAQISAAEAQISAMQANVTSARGRHDDATLTSPLTGVVAEVTLSIGDQVSGATGTSLGSGGPLPGIDIPGLSGGSLGGSSGSSATVGSGHIVIIKPDAWTLEATVGTADLPTIAPGQEAIVTPTGTSLEVSAVVDTVGIVASQDSGGAARFPVNLSITDPEVDLFTGSDADAVILSKVVPDVLTIPAAAITYADETATVQRPDGSTVEITAGRRFGDRQEVLSGISEGDEVLVPRGTVVTGVPRGPFGPNGTFTSPDTTTPER